MGNLFDGVFCSQAWALFQELEGQLRMQLLCQKWPAEIAAKYARAYARHGECSC